MTTNSNAPAMAQHGAGRGIPFAAATDAPKLSAASNRGNENARYRVIPPGGGDASFITVKGRVRWALDKLRHAGWKGCTPIEEVGPRWSAYVHKLREAGVIIDTLREPHYGAFPGHHARYVLRSSVTPCRDGGSS